MIIFGKISRIGVILCLFVLFVNVIWVPVSDKKQFRIVALDVGQGSAIYIETHNGIELVLDTGPSMNILRQLQTYRNALDRTIDYLIISHIDMDHMAMAPVLLHRYNIIHFVTTIDESTNGLYTHTVDALQESNSRIITPEPGTRQVIDVDTYIEYLWPYSSDLNTLSKNDSSLVVRVVHKNVSMLYTGDISLSVEQKLIAMYGDALGSDILFVSHHGSKTSTGYDFVRAVNPTYAVIQSGADNRYGHPHENTLNTLQQLQIPILRNDLLGNIEFITDGENLLVQ